MFGLALLFVCVSSVLLAFDHLAWGRGRWSLCLSCICLLAMHTIICHFFSSSWCQGLAATSACGSSWTFLFTFLYTVSRLWFCTHPLGYGFVYSQLVMVLYTFISYGFVYSQLVMVLYIFISYGFVYSQLVMVLYIFISYDFVYSQLVMVLFTLISYGFVYSQLVMVLYIFISYGLVYSQLVMVLHIFISYDFVYSKLVKDFVLIH